MLAINTPRRVLNKLINRSLIFGIILAISQPITVANAGDFSWTSQTDTYTSFGIDPNYDLDFVSIRQFPDSPGKLYFFLHLIRPVKKDLFNVPGKGPWAAVLLYWNDPGKLGGNNENFRIYIPTNFRQNFKMGRKSTSIEAGVAGSDGNLIKSFKHCSPEVYANIDEGKSWIGFIIDQTCANIPNNFYVTGFIEENDYLSTSLYDYAPEKVQYVSISSALATPTPTPKFASNPTQIQEITVDGIPNKAQYLSTGSISFQAWSSSGIAVEVESLDTEICEVYGFDGDFTIDLVRNGGCQIVVKASGNDLYFPTEEFFSFDIISKSISKSKSGVKGKASPSPKATSKVTAKSITCLKGSSKIVVKGNYPKCPAGYIKQ
jgi:hypothetical protein